VFWRVQRYADITFTAGGATAQVLRAAATASSTPKALPERGDGAAAVCLPGGAAALARAARPTQRRHYMRFSASGQPGVVVRFRSGLWRRKRQQFSGLGMQVLLLPPVPPCLPADCLCRAFLVKGGKEDVSTVGRTKGDRRKP